MKLISHLVSPDEFGKSLQKSLRDAPRGGLFRIAIAYVSVGGAKKLKKYLRRLIKRNGTIEIIAGLDIGYDSVRGIQEVAHICGPGSVFIFWNPAGYTFHPKVYCLTDAKMKAGSFWVGSSNFTERGLFKNYECNLHLRASDEDNQLLLEQINEYFVQLRKSAFCQPATSELIKILIKSESKRKRKEDRLPPTRFPPEIRDKFSAKIKTKRLGKGFTMLLSYNDVSGRRFEPYFLIPVRARDENRQFWGWPDEFSPSQRSGMPEKRIESNIHVGALNYTENKRIYWVEERDEFRFVSPVIYRLGVSFIGNILHVKRNETGYSINVIPPTDSRFPILVKHAVNLSSNQKKWGYIS